MSGLSGLKAIVAADRSWGIGRDGGLLYDLPSDRKYFRQMTLGGTLILGRKTLDSFPGGRPLPKRRHLVLSRSRDDSVETVTYLPDLSALEEALKALPAAEREKLFVAGGGSIYRQLLLQCDTVYVTHIDADAGADTFFPNLSADPEWFLASLSTATATASAAAAVITTAFYANI